jgi:hypothetical protein
MTSFNLKMSIKILLNINKVYTLTPSSPANLSLILMQISARIIRIIA